MPAKLNTEEAAEIDARLNILGHSKAKVRRDTGRAFDTIDRYQNGPENKDDIQGYGSIMETYKKELISGLQSASMDCLGHIQKALASDTFEVSDPSALRHAATSLGILVDKLSLIEQGPVNPVNAVALFLSPNESPTEQLNLARAAIERSSHTAIHHSLPNSRP